MRQAKALRLLRDIVWKAASEPEREEIKTVVGNSLEIHVAPNMPPRMIFENYDQAARSVKIAGEAKMIFLSRFMRKKNLNWLLEHIGSIKGELLIDICGTLEEADYWDECRRIIKTLPSNIRVAAK